MANRTRPACGLKLALVVLVPAVFCVTSARTADESKKTNGPVTLNELSMEVNALEALRMFQFTPEQMKTLRKLAKTTSQEPGARQASKASDDYRTALVDLRNALVDNEDVERIDELRERLDKLRDAENPMFDDEVEITEEAGQHASEVLRFLSPRQVALFLAYQADAAPDPIERIVEALDKVRGLGPKEWKQAREEVATDVGRLVAGLDFDKASRVSDQVVQLLIQARAFKDEEFKTQRPELEKTARKIVGDLGPLEVLRHLVEQALAELLSNPRLPVVLEACLKK
jgi:hypothetical protein